MKNRVWKLMMAVALSVSVTASLGGASQVAFAEESTEDAGLTEKNETEEVDIATYRDAIQGSGDAYYCWEGSYVWEALTMNNGGVIEPWLAESWEHNDECTEWTFHLRQDAYFTDGQQFDADVCLANIERWGHELSSCYTTLSIEKSLPNLDKMEKTDDFTVKFTFTEPVTTLEYILSDYGSPMFSTNCFDAETGVISDYAIGTGPYKIVDHVDSQYALFERNDDYYGEKGLVKTIRIRCIPDAETRISAMKAGEVMGLADNGAITMDAALELCQNDPDTFAMDSTPSHMTEYLMFNYANEKLQDVRLRQALSLAIDKQTICDVLYGGLLEPAYSFLSTQSVFHLDIQGSYDMDQAKELAAEALGGETVDMTLIMRSDTASNYNVKAVGEYLAQVFAELGVNVNIEVLDSDTIKERQSEGSWDLYLNVFGINNADPTSTFASYFTKEGTQNNTYNMQYYNEQVEELVAKAPTITDADERSQVYDEIQQLLYDEVACVPICYQINVNIHNTAIEGYAGKTFGVGLPTIHWVK